MPNTPYRYDFTKGGQIIHTSINQKIDWALDLCILLDKIDLAIGDNEELRRLCKTRFDIARKHGSIVVFKEG